VADLQYNEDVDAYIGLPCSNGKSINMCPASA